MNQFILVVDDEESLAFFLKDALEMQNYEAEVAHRIERALQIIDSRFPDLMILDLNLPDGNGLDLYKAVKDRGLDIPTVVITAHASVDSAVEAMKMGVDDYVIKPFELNEILVIIKKQLDRYRLNNQFNYYKKRLQQAYQDEFFISQLPQIQEIQDLALKIAQVEESTILIEGPSGTGKEMLARFIHQNSPQSDSPFVEINCASLPENLLESELFGYEPGAFTDAKKRKIGLIELASNGTLFLDEISEMTPSLQAKLLRVIETRVFKRLGGIRDIKVKLRIIAATNQNIQEKVETKEFREDLYFRLNTFHIKLPPLKERREEILLIAQFFLEKNAKKLRHNVSKISPEAQETILNYDWPGNLRELNNSIERAVILCEGDTIERKHLPCEITGMFSESPISYIPTLKDLHGKSMKEFLEEIERQLVIQALNLSNGNQIQAAKILNEPRHIVRYLVKKHGIKG